MHPELIERLVEKRRSPVTDMMRGAAAGAAAVWLMDRVDWFNYRREDPESRQRTSNVRPMGLPPADVAVARMAEAASIELPAHRRDALGKAVHYAIGIVPGAIYGALRERKPGISAGRGSVFGLGLFLLHDELMNPMLGLSAKPQDYPWQAHARGLAAHLVYGFALDAILRATKASRGPDGRFETASI